MKVDVASSKLPWLQYYCNYNWKMLHAKHSCGCLYLSNYRLIVFKKLFVHFYFLCYASPPQNWNYLFKPLCYRRAIYAIEV